MKLLRTYIKENIGTLCGDDYTMNQISFNFAIDYIQKVLLGEYSHTPNVSSPPVEGIELMRSLCNSNMIKFQQPAGRHWCPNCAPEIFRDRR